MSEIGFGFEIKAIDEAGYIAGIAASYGNVDHGGDLIMPGALTKAIAGRASVPMLLFHDHKRPVGAWSKFDEAASAKRTNRSLVRSKRKIDLTADLLRADTVDFLADVTVSFDNLGYSHAGDATGNDLFKALYGDRKYGWVIEQVNAHLADWASFTKGSATS